MINTILVSVSGSPETIQAAKYAIALSQLLHAKLVAVFVIDVKVLCELLKSRIFVEAEARSYERDLEQQGQVVLERIKKMAESKQVACQTYLLSGAIAEQVISKAGEVHADLLVMEELKEITSRTEIFYNEGERIFRNSPCPVVIVKNHAMVEELYKEIP